MNKSTQELIQKALEAENIKSNADIFALMRDKDKLMRVAGEVNKVVAKDEEAKAELTKMAQEAASNPDILKMALGAMPKPKLVDKVKNIFKK